jgi:hypothetical protein
MSAAEEGAGDWRPWILLGGGFRWIAPSRFGYLGSAVPEAATPDTQAHAYAWLLDELGIGFGIFQTNPPPKFVDEMESPLGVTPARLVGRWERR